MILLCKFQFHQKRETAVFVESRFVQLLEILKNQYI